MTVVSLTTAFVVISRFLVASLRCLLTFLFSWYGGFCHRTGSELFIFHQFIITFAVSGKVVIP